MKKDILPVASQIYADFVIGMPANNSKFENFVKAQYESFDSYLAEKAEELETAADFVETLKNKPLYNAIAKVSVRQRIVANWCEVRNPVEIEEPEEASDSEILEFNGLPSDLADSMESDAFNSLMKKLKTPASKKMGKRERQELIERHYAKLQPAYPSEKTFEHNGKEGTTFGYHWSAEIQDQYLEDHIAFVEHFGINDRFHSEEPETVTDESEETDS